MFLRGKTKGIGRCNSVLIKNGFFPLKLLGVGNEQTVRTQSLRQTVRRESIVGLSQRRLTPE